MHVLVLLLQVLEPPAKPQANNQIAPSSVDVFVGTTARIQVHRLAAVPRCCTDFSLLGVSGYQHLRFQASTF